MTMVTVPGLEGQREIPDGLSPEEEQEHILMLHTTEPLKFENLQHNPTAVTAAKGWYKRDHGEEFNGDNKLLIDKWASYQSALTVNEAYMLRESQMDLTDEEKYDRGVGMQVWDRVENREWMDIVSDYAIPALTSPSAIASIALTPFTAGGSFALKAGTMAAMTAARTAFKASVFQGFKSMAKTTGKMALSNPVKITAAEFGIGAVGGGVHESARQDMEMNTTDALTFAPVREKKDYERVVMSSALTGAMAGGATAGFLVAGKAIRAYKSGRMASNLLGEALDESPATLAARAANKGAKGADELLSTPTYKTPFDRLRTQQVPKTDGATTTSTVTTGPWGGRDGTKGSTTTSTYTPGPDSGGLSTLLGGGVVNGIMQSIQRGLTSSAGLPQQLADIASYNRRQIASKDTAIKRDISNFEVLFKKEDPKGRNFESLSEAEMMPYLQLLHGDDSAAGVISAVMQDSVLGLRKNIADTTKFAIDSGMVKGETLLGKMKLGMEKLDYVNRSYRVHTDADWANKIMKEPEWDAAKTYLRKLYKNKKLESEIQAILYDIVSNTGENKLALGMLKKRENIPKEIRKLMGENVDIRTAYQNTIKKVHASTADHEFRRNFVEMGMDLGLLTKTFSKGLQTLNTEGRKFSLDEQGLTKILGDMDAKQIVADPMDGVFAHPAFVKAYKSMREDILMKGASKGSLGKTGAVLQSAFSMGHTIFSPVTISRNLVSGGLLNASAGNFLLNPLFRLIDGTVGKEALDGASDAGIVGVTSLFKKLHRKSKIGDEELNLLREASEYGVLQQSLDMEILQRNLNDFSNLNRWTKEIEQWVEKGGTQGGRMGNTLAAKSLRQAKRKGLDAPIRFYALMDDVNKLLAWDTEFRVNKLSYAVKGSPGKYQIPKRLAESSRYGGVVVRGTSGDSSSTTLAALAKTNAVAGAKEAMVEVDEQVLKALAAKKSTMYYPTYDQIAPWVQNMRKLPFGNFVSFTAEMARNTKNNIMLAAEEMYSGNAVMASRGMTRLASLVGVTSW